MQTELLPGFAAAVVWCCCGGDSSRSVYSINESHLFFPMIANSDVPAADCSRAGQGREKMMKSPDVHSRTKVSKSKQAG